MSALQRDAKSPVTVARVQTPFRRFAAAYMESRIAVAALIGLAVIVFIALFAPWLSPQDPYDLAVVTIILENSFGHIFLGS